MKEIKRFDEIDILKSIGIILMIMGHIGFGEIFDHYIHAFHMPMFYLISGFLYRKSNLCFKSFVLKMSRSLLIPYVIFAFFHLIIQSVLKMNIEPIWLINIFSFNTDYLAISGALWFLTSLFFVDVIYYLLDRIDNSHLKFVSTVCVTVGGYIIPLFFRLPLALDTSMMGIGLFAIGRYGKTFIMKNHKLSSLIIGRVVFIAGSIISFINGYVNVRLGMYSNPILFFIAAVFITYGLYLFCLKVGRMQNIVLKEMKFIGRNSIVYVCLNQLILLVPNKISAVYINCTPVLAVYKIIVLVISLLLLHLLSILLNTNYLKWVLGR